ncbi:MAG: selenide, water dikinase SelD [Fusobacteria bacterium]|nr:selenide, water dikinase SelD [Fusobacteriota bacterium]
MTDVKLTQYSHGAGCGCKLSPHKLEKILKSARPQVHFPELLVGNNTKDDAAAFDLGNGTSVLSTTDFFMPIVDDPFTFGKIAATNAISDIYAMGGKPLMAIAIFGWPIKLLPESVGREVIEGGRAACEEAGIPLAGGHSIDSLEPIFGLAVTGIVENSRLKKNCDATEGCEIFLTKPLGIGILTTAQKQDKIEGNDIDAAVDAMCTMNKIGGEISALPGVTALTDVTGFGFLGHLLEICESSHINAVIDYAKIPLLKNVRKYIALGCIPGGTRNNFRDYGHKVELFSEEQEIILCDAQTSGGLLAIVRNDSVEAFKSLCTSQGLILDSIGYTTPEFSKEKWIKVV